MKKLILKSTPRSKIYAAVSAKIKSTEVVDKWLKAAEGALGELEKDSPIHIDATSATFEMPNRLLVRLGIGINKAPDVLVRNEGIIRRKINEFVGKPVVNAVIYTSLLFAQLEIVDIVNVGVLYHDARIQVPHFASLMKVISEM